MRGSRKTQEKKSLDWGWTLKKGTKALAMMNEKEKILDASSLKRGGKIGSVVNPEKKKEVIESGCAVHEEPQKKKHKSWKGAAFWRRPRRLRLRPSGKKRPGAKKKGSKGYLLDSRSTFLQGKKKAVDP